MGGQSRPASASWTPRAKNTDSADMTRARRCLRHVAVDSQGSPCDSCDHGRCYRPGRGFAMFEQSRADLSRVQNVMVTGVTLGSPLPGAEPVGSLGGGGETQRTAHLRGAAETMGGRRSFAWLEKCRRLWKNCEGKLNTSLQMVVLAFAVLILKRL